MDAQFRSFPVLVLASDDRTATVYLAPPFEAFLVFPTSADRFLQGGAFSLF